MDDTPGQISAQLESAHGRRQLTLGYLTHPRRDGQAGARGEGFELATNDSGAIRTAKFRARGGNHVYLPWWGLRHDATISQQGFSK